MEAFYNSALYRFYYPLLWRYARRLTGNQTRAQQIALHVLWGHYLIYAAGSWEGERKLLHTSVLNHCIAAREQDIFNRPAIQNRIIPMTVPQDPLCKWLKGLFELKPKNPT